MERCVLVVEDEPIIRMGAVAMLEEAGLMVVDFDRADDALRYADDHGRDVAALFTDVDLRGLMDGLELAATVSRRHPDVAIVVTSGRFEGNASRLPPGARFLRKPWLPLQVLTALQDAVVH